MSDDNDPDCDHTPIDMHEINRLVAKQHFIGLQQMIINTNNVGSDVVILLAMCTLLHSMTKALREEVHDLRTELAISRQGVAAEIVGYDTHHG